MEKMKSPFPIKEYSFISIFLKSQIFIPQNWKEWKGMKLDLMNILLKLLKYPYIFNHLF